MTIQDFKAKWRAVALKESAASQEHFIDLCRALGMQTPAEADSAGAFYTFERGVAKSGGGKGFADVWYRSHFAWEYKGRHANLNAASRPSTARSGPPTAGRKTLRRPTTRRSCGACWR